MLWASERLILGEKKKMVEYPGKADYNSLSFPGTVHTKKSESMCEDGKFVM